jgi:hypothetical protein
MNIFKEYSHFTLSWTSESTAERNTMYRPQDTTDIINRNSHTQKSFATNRSTKPTGRKMPGGKYLQANTISIQANRLLGSWSHAQIRQRKFYVSSIKTLLAIAMQSSAWCFHLLSQLIPSHSFRVRRKTAKKTLLLQHCLYLNRSLTINDQIYGVESFRT